MAYDPGAIETALASALGDAPGLIAELRGAFFASAVGHIAALRVAQTKVQWDDAAARLKGLAACFGAARLMAAADHLRALDRIDHAALRRVDRALAVLRD